MIYMRTRISTDKAGEKWLPWAKHKLAQLAALRRDLRLPKLTKAFVPASGVRIRMTADEFGNWIRITAATGSLRAWLAAAPTVAVHANFALKVLADQDKAFADWSPDYKTFAYWSGTQVTLRRGGAAAPEYAMAGTTVQTPDDDRRTFYQNSIAWMANDGRYAVAKVAPASVSATSLFSVARWNATTASFDTATVGFPPGTPAASVDFATTFGDVTRGFASKLLKIYSPITAACAGWEIGGGSNLPASTAFRWRLFGNVPRGDKVYLQLSYPEYVSHVLKTSGVSVQIADVTMRHLCRIWAYDIATDTWSIANSGLETTGSWAASWGTRDSGVFSSTQLEPVSSLDYGYIEGLLDENGDLRVITVDPRVLGATGNRPFTPVDSGVACTGGGAGLPATSVTSQLYTQADTVTINLDGTAWITNVGWNPAAIDPIVNIDFPYSTVFGGEVTYKQVNSNRTGLIAAAYTAGAARDGLIQRYDDAAGGEYNQATIEAALLSCQGHFLYAGTGKRTVRRDGALVYTFAAVSPDEVHRVGARTDPRVFARVATIAPSFTIHGFDGTIHTPLGDIDVHALVGASGVLGPDGEGAYLATGQLLSTAFLEGAFGAPVTYTFTTPHDLVVPPTTVNTLGIYTMTDNGDGTWSPVLVQAITQGPYATSEGAATFANANIVPDDFVLGAKDT